MWYTKFVEDFKRCSKCGEEKPLSEFYRSKNHKDGLQYWCKGCVKEYQQEYRQTPEYKAFQQEYQREYRQEYRQTPEHKAFRQEYQREYQREYRQTPEYKEAERKRRQTPEYKEAERKRRQTPEYKEAERKRRQTPEFKEAERKRMQTPEYKEVERKRRQTPDGKATKRRGNHKRRALKANCTTESIDETKIWDECDNQCIYCGSTERLELDHVIALSNGGPNCESNLVIACKPCNSSKNAKPVAEWLLEDHSRSAHLRPLSDLQKNKKLQPFLTKRLKVTLHKATCVE